MIDEASYTARLRRRTLDLTFKEFELLKFLAQHPARVFTRSQLLQEVWGYDYFGGTRTVDVHVRRLRAKLGAEHEQMIGTVRNVGYRFVPPARTAARADGGARQTAGARRLMTVAGARTRPPAASAPGTAGPAPRWRPMPTPDRPAGQIDVREALTGADAAEVASLVEAAARADGVHAAVRARAAAPALRRRPGGQGPAPERRRRARRVRPPGPGRARGARRAPPAR